MDAYLHQSQSQRQVQVLAPQLRQSLEILQAPMQELHTLISKELEINPTLDMLDPEMERVEVEPDRDESFEDVTDREFEEEFEMLARLDDDSRSLMRRNEVLRRPSSDEDSMQRFMMESITAAPSLQEHLMAQVHLTDLDAFGCQLAEVLIGSLNNDGYLSTPLEELADGIGASVFAFEEVLDVVREFDPVGIASRNLRECLLMQLERMGKKDSVAWEVVDGYLRDLGGHKYAEIARRIGVDVEDVREAAKVIATLNPKPGRQFTDDAAVYVVPEVVVTRSKGGWKVQTRDDYLPRLRISTHYRDLMKDAGTSKEVKRYIRDKVKAGSQLMKSIGQRQSTIRRIAEELVRVQEGFLEEGVSKLRPLTMAEVAERLGVHETTVSRASSNKYMQTPQGVYELKFFFTPGYQGGDGESVSNQSIKEAIRNLVEAENPAKPLSDQAMVTALKEQGYDVARRTIAKYRDQLKILPSHLRKQT